MPVQYSSIRNCYLYTWSEFDPKAAHIRLVFLTSKMPMNSFNIRVLARQCYIFHWPNSVYCWGRRLAGCLYDNSSELSRWRVGIYHKPFWKGLDMPIQFSWAWKRFDRYHPNAERPVLSPLDLGIFVAPHTLTRSMSGASKSFAPPNCLSIIV